MSVLRFLLATTGLLIGLSAATAQESQRVEINFAAAMGGKPFVCGESYSGIGSTGSTVTPTDFRLFVSEVALLKADGSATFVTLDQDGRWQHQNVALLDFENGQGPCVNGTAPTNTTLRGSVPKGDYTGLIFSVGVPFALNHGDPTLAASPLNLTAMFWNWQGGYKFIKIDMATSGLPMNAPQPAAAHSPPQPGQAAPAARPSGWSLHLGSTVCAAPSRTTPAASCANPNRLTVRMDRFDSRTNVVVFDPAPVLATANVDTNAPETSPGCMSFPNDPDCLGVMSRLGFAYGGEAPQPQAFVTRR
jgi:uncharacterized repeat protein (TIGR04052 family)